MQQGIKSTTLNVWTFWNVFIFREPLLSALFSPKQIHSFSSYLPIILTTMLLLSLKFQLWKDILASAGNKWKFVCFSWGLEARGCVRGEGDSVYFTIMTKKTLPKSWQLLSIQLTQTGACRIFQGVRWGPDQPSDKFLSAGLDAQMGSAWVPI